MKLWLRINMYSTLPFLTWLTTSREQPRIYIRKKYICNVAQTLSKGLLYSHFCLRAVVAYTNGSLLQFLPVTAFYRYLRLPEGLRTHP